MDPENIMWNENKPDTKGCTLYEMKRDNKVPGTAKFIETENSLLWLPRTGEKERRE